MPYTIYAKIIRKGKKRHKVRNTGVYTIHVEIISLQDVLDYFHYAAKTVFYDYGEQIVSEVTLEKHLKGKYIAKTKHYRQSKLHFNREPCIGARLTYNPQMDKTKVDRVSFMSPEFLHFKADYDIMRGKKWKLPKVNPSGFQASMLNPNMLFFDNLTLKTPNYAATPPTEAYATHQEKSHSDGIYPTRARGMYFGPDRAEFEEEKNIRDNQA